MKPETLHRGIGGSKVRDLCSQYRPRVIFDPVRVQKFFSAQLLCQGLHRNQLKSD